jgi:hypothetical protein
MPPSAIIASPIVTVGALSFCNSSYVAVSVVDPTVPCSTCDSYREVSVDSAIGSSVVATVAVAVVAPAKNVTTTGVVA